MAAAAAALDKDEQALFDAIKNEKEPPAKAESDEAAKSAAKDAAAATAKAAEKAAKGADASVPKAALDEARIENKELRGQLKEMQKLVAEGDKKLQKFISGVEERLKEKPAAAPKFEDDPGGHLKSETETLKAQNDELRKNLAAINEKLAKQDEGAKGADAIQRHAANVSAQEQAFAKEHPDYFKAAEFVAQVWRDEFLEAGYPAENVPQQVFHKSLAITHQAVGKEKNAAETIYKLAKRYGWTGEAPKEAKEEGKEAAKVEDKKADGEAKLETLAKGLDAAKSAGGGSGPDDLTIASLANMTDDQLDAAIRDPDWWAKNVKRSPLH